MNYNNSANNQAFKHNTLIAIAVLIFIILILISRLFWLQIIHHKQWATLSNHNTINIVPEAPRRGLIYDRNGILLAKNKLVYDLTITPGQIKNLAHTLSNLRTIISLSDDEIARFNKERNISGDRR